jgi:LAO/AO transport system kinase
MASRGHLGGLASAATEALRVYDLAGFDTVLVETVGVGQSEVEIVETADTVMVLLAPGMGDGVQAAKAGILEIGDIFVVNKSDHEGAQSLIRDLRSMIGLGKFGENDWKPPIVRTVALHNEGVDDLLSQIDNHRDWGQRTGAWATRRTKRAATEVQGLVLGKVSAGIRSKAAEDLKSLSAAVAQGQIDPYTAADQILAKITD